MKLSKRSRESGLWRQVPLKRVAALNPEVLPEDTDPDFAMVYVDIGGVSLERGIWGTETLRFSNAPSRARRLVKVGDTIVSTVRTYLRAIAPVVDPPDNLVVSTGFAVIRSNGSVDPDFLSWALRSSRFIDAVVAESVGVSYPAIAPTVLGRIPIAVPPKSDQQAIADFLDRETAKIDALIAKQTEFLMRLDEHRRALITEAVTRGRNPKVQMRGGEGSGLPALPTHWVVKRVKHLTLDGSSGIQIGPFGSTLTDLPVQNTGFALYGQRNTISGDFDECSRWITEEFFRSSPQYHMRPGDLVVTRKGSLGNCRIVPEGIKPGCFDSDTIRIRLNQKLVSARFVEKVLHDAPYLEVQLAETKRGAVLGGLNSEVIGNLRILVPPLDEQVGILSFLDAALKRIEHVGRSAMELVGRLSERRSALITAAVTGQIDLTEPVLTEAAA